jgi:hypothetical protein
VSAAGVTRVAETKTDRDSESDSEHKSVGTKRMCRHHWFTETMTDLSLCAKFSLGG